MARFLTIVMLLQLSLIVVALVDCLSAEPKAVRSLPRGAWIFLILLTSPIGALAWFVAGQPAPAIRARSGKVIRPGAPVARRPMGPEDDSAFIASLAETIRPGDRD
jgi:hypothetical protein